MHVRSRHLIDVLSTGAMVVILALVVLFAGRWYCHLLRLNAMEREANQVGISPIGLPSLEDVDDPNPTVRSSVIVNLKGSTGLVTGLGSAQYVLDEVPTAPGSRVFEWELEPGGEQLYYDSTLGLMVHKGTSETRDPSGKVHRRHLTYYAGPEGIAATYNEALGQFGSPIASRLQTDPQIVYDETQRRFFAIDWRDQSVEKGPELPDDQALRPVQIGPLQKNSMCLDIEVRWPQFDSQDGRPEVKPAGAVPCRWLPPEQAALVLDASGRIHWLDVATLQLKRGVGHLVTPRTLIGKSRSVRPEDVAAFEVTPISLDKRPPMHSWEYLGCAVTVVSRDLTAMRMTVFDPNGHAMASGDTVVRDHLPRRYPVSSAKAAYSLLPGVVPLTLAKYALESLHPPVLLLLSHFTASQQEATAAYRSIFVLPNSFLAMNARDMGRAYTDRLGTTLLLMLPGLGVAAFLGWRVSRDAGRIGLPREAKTFWVVGIFAFSVPAYLTYRLTRPKVTLVTCGSCGLGRRPDFEKCHRCGAAWVVPELVPPEWRVVDAESTSGEAPSRTQEAISEGS